MYYFKNINSKCTFPFWNVCHFTYPIIQNHFTVFYWGCPFLFWCPCCQKVYSLSLNRRKSQKLTLLWKSAFETDNLRMAGNSPVQQWLAFFYTDELTGLTSSAESAGFSGSVLPSSWSSLIPPSSFSLLVDLAFNLCWRLAWAKRMDRSRQRIPRTPA